MVRAAVLGAWAFAAVVLWWTVRRQRERRWLPVLRILEAGPRPRPRIRWERPPLLAWLAFALVALLMVILSSEPHVILQRPPVEQARRTHVRLDLSPSNSARLSIAQYASHVADLVRELLPSAQVTLSSTHSDEHTRVSSPEEAAAWVQRLGYHRVGARLGQSLHSVMDRGSEGAERLIFVSDGDQNSWGGFNWESHALTADIYVDWIGATARERSANTFVAQVRTRRDSTRGSWQWEVSLARTSREGSQSGRITARVETWRQGGGEGTGAALSEVAGPVTRDGPILVESVWQIADGDDHVTFNVQPTHAHGDFDKVLRDSGTEVTGGMTEAALRWQIEVDGGDAIAEDNIFRTYLVPRDSQILLLAPIAGEGRIEDPAFALEQALAATGARVRRLDTAFAPWRRRGFEGRVPERVVALVGGVGDTCPSSLLLDREAVARGLRVWLIPAAASDTDYGHACRCLGRVLRAMSGESQAGGGTAGEDPVFCQNVKTREQWVGLLPSIGGQQIGGRLGDNGLSAIAQRFGVQASRHRLLVMTLPLQPQRAQGVGHGDLPRWVDALLALDAAGPVEGRSRQLSMGDEPEWPRHESLEDAIAGAGLIPIELSNVPAGESVLVSMDPAKMPPRWGERDQSDERAAGAASMSQASDPRPWIYWCFAVMLGVFLIEALVTLWGVKARGRRRAGGGESLATSAPGSGLAWLVLGLGLGAQMLGPMNEEVQAQVVITQWEEKGAMTFADLAGEVGRRTSIDLGPKAVQGRPGDFRSVGADGVVGGGGSPARFEDPPWIWISAQDLGGVVADGRRRATLQQWLRRGGFLVIEGSGTGAGASSDAEYMAQLEEGLVAGSSWSVVPPDHELMRSFYLLSSLPACAGTSWRSLRSDRRVAALYVPFALARSLSDGRAAAINAFPLECPELRDLESLTRSFVNILMVALTTDYKSDQIHLPEILKRLR